MGLFKKKPRLTATELRCPADGCSFICSDSATLKKHTEWKHPQLTQSKAK